MLLHSFAWQTILSYFCAPMMEIDKLLEEILPANRIKCRLIDLTAFASDAGFYYLRPKAVVVPNTEEEIKALFRFSQLHNIPLTFRAAGTSLSGQSISDGILVDLSKSWSGITIENGGEQVRVQPGITGAIVNAHLHKYRKKIGPDPASINSAMMGGILSNNASGMCCGVSKNSYHTTKYIRFVLPNGKIFTTEKPEDYTRFREECPDIYAQIQSLKETILAQPDLKKKIREKYQTKNTVGYSVNAFIDYDDPLDILAHVLIGSEGTLGFIAEAVLNTVPDYPAKSTALLYFNNMYDACQAIVPLISAGAEAIELMDRASLRSIEHIPGLPEIIKSLPQEAAALLVEFQANSTEEVEAKQNIFLQNADELLLLTLPEFTQDPAQQALMWKVRKGMYPAVGAVRARGTTVILEDIAFPVDKLGDAILDLQQLFKKYEYHNAIIFGHAREGNIHFVITQAFDSPEEVDRYDRFIREVVTLVVHKYNGALKAEHGTGRNMAPFVETEWGLEIYTIMKSLKACIDPHNLLNPGVIINNHKEAHIQNLKDLPEVEEEVDKCMDCGFCEHRCPSRNITLTPRQRIVVRRELKRLELAGNKEDHRQLLKEFKYDGMDTCAVDGLCADACPVDINTGSLIKRLRRENHNPFSKKVALWASKNFKLVAHTVKFGLQTGNAINSVFGKNAMHNLTGGLKKILPAMPLWSNQLIAAPSVSKIKEKFPVSDRPPAIVYFPACISQVMGGSKTGKASVMETFLSVSAKAGIEVVIPKEVLGSCCGQPFSSKGFNDAYAYMANQTIAKLWTCTQEGKLPVVLDITACTHTLHDCRPILTTEHKQYFDKLNIIDSIDYIADYVLPNATVRTKKSSIAVHPVCSLYHMGMTAKFVDIAKQLADHVEVPMHVGCCGMAGDRGFLFPELTHSATLPEAMDLKGKTFEGYYSTSKTCEIAMSDAVGENYQSILYLVEEGI